MADISKVDTVSEANIGKMIGRTKTTGDGFLNILVPASSTDLIVKSETYTAVMTTTINTLTVTLTSTFTEAQTALFPAWMRGNSTSDDMDESHFMHELTSPTTVRITRDSLAGGPVDFTIIGQAVEFNSGTVTAVHKGTVTIPVSTLDATSSAFNATKANCALLFMGQRMNESADIYRNAYSRIEKTGSDGAVTVKATRNVQTSADHVTTSFALVEFESGKTKSIQDFSIILGGTEISDTATITSVDITKSLLFFGGWSTDSITSELDGVFVRGALTSATQVTAVRGNHKDPDETYINGTVVYLDDTAVNFTSIEMRGAASLTNTQTSADIALTTTLTDTSKAILSWNGITRFRGSIPDLEPRYEFPTVEITSATTVRMRRAAAANTSCKVSYQVIQG